MTLNQSRQGVSHVIKSTSSLDFFSNATKSTTTNSFVNAVDTTRFRRPEELKSKPRVMRSTIQPFHPFLNATETYKLSLVSHSSRASRPLTHESTLSNGQTKISNDFDFISGREAWEFVNMMRQGYFQLDPVSSQRPDVTVISIDEHVAEVIAQKLDNELTLDALSELLMTPIINSSSTQATLEDKMTYIVSNYLTPKTMPVMFKFIENYILIVDNPELAFKVFNISSNCATRHGSGCKKYFLQPLEELHQILIQTYPILAESTELQASFLRTLLFYKQTSKAHDIMLRLEQSGHCADSTTFSRYLRLSKMADNSPDNIDVLTRLRGLDDTIFTVLNQDVAQQLISISKSIKEISSILDMLEMKYEPEQLQLIVPNIENTVCQTMKSFSSESPSFQGMTQNNIFPQKIGVLHRLAKYSPWSAETRLFIIEQGITHGAFILARHMLDKTSLNQEAMQSLKRLADGDNVKKLISESKPGQDPLSYRELVKRLGEAA